MTTKNRLGDRHGENILLDSKNGDCVHVDFNCLFFKGTTFEKPEKVPFRLTHNMSDAMGITRHEGVFRRVCELTLHLLRSHRETLMSVLETFIYDPLVEWSSGNMKKMVFKTDLIVIVPITNGFEIYFRLLVVKSKIQKQFE